MCHPTHPTAHFSNSSTPSLPPPPPPFSPPPFLPGVLMSHRTPSANFLQPSYSLKKRLSWPEDWPSPAARATPLGEIYELCDSYAEYAAANPGHLIIDENVAAGAAGGAEEVGGRRPKACDFPQGRPVPKVRAESTNKRRDARHILFF